MNDGAAAQVRALRTHIINRFKTRSTIEVLYLFWPNPLSDDGASRPLYRPFLTIVFVADRRIGHEIAHRIYLVSVTFFLK